MASSLHRPLSQQELDEIFRLIPDIEVPPSAHDPQLRHLFLRYIQLARTTVAKLKLIVDVLNTWRPGLRCLKSGKKQEIVDRLIDVLELKVSRSQPPATDIRTVETFAVSAISNIIPLSDTDGPKAGKPPGTFDERYGKHIRKLALLQPILELGTFSKFMESSDLWAWTVPTERYATALQHKKAMIENRTLRLLLFFGNAINKKVMEVNHVVGRGYKVVSQHNTQLVPSSPVNKRWARQHVDVSSQHPNPMLWLRNRIMNVPVTYPWPTFHFRVSVPREVDVAAYLYVEATVEQVLLDIYERSMRHYGMPVLPNRTVEDLRQAFITCLQSQPDFLQTPITATVKDEDEHVLMEQIVTFRCPLTYTRMVHPGRSRYCQHLNCFDVHHFLELNKHMTKPECAYCSKPIAFDEIIIDATFLDRLIRYPDLDSVLVYPDGKDADPAVRNVSPSITEREDSPANAASPRSDPTEEGNEMPSVSASVKMSSKPTMACSDGSSTPTKKKMVVIDLVSSDDETPKTPPPPSKKARTIIELD